MLFTSGQLLIDLQQLTYVSTKTSRMEFIATWFEKLRQLNKIADPTNRLGYDITRSLVLLATFRSDVHMTDTFTQFKPKGNSVVDIEAMKLHLLERSSLYDGMGSLHGKSGRSTPVYAQSHFSVPTTEDDIALSQEFQAFRVVVTLLPASRRPYTLHWMTTLGNTGLVLTWTHAGASLLPWHLPMPLALRLARLSSSLSRPKTLHRSRMTWLLRTRSPVMSIAS